MTDDELTLKAAEDARLLDAARDMLEALKLAHAAFMAMPRSLAYDIHPGRAVAQAIAKAEGA